jgi:hypothetical protein
MAESNPIERYVGIIAIIATSITGNIIVDKEDSKRTDKLLESNNRMLRVVLSNQKHYTKLSRAATLINPTCFRAKGGTAAPEVEYLQELDRLEDAERSILNNDDSNDDSSVEE